MQHGVCHFINCHIAGCIVFSMSYYINSYPKQMNFSKEQILELCYIAYPWAQERIDSGEVTKEEEDEGFLENPVMWPFPYENWLYNNQPAPSYENLKKWVESRVHITGRC